LSEMDAEILAQKRDIATT